MAVRIFSSGGHKTRPYDFWRPFGVRTYMKQVPTTSGPFGVRTCMKQVPTTSGAFQPRRLLMPVCPYKNQEWRCSKRCGCRDLLHACPYKNQEWRCSKRCGCRDLLYACPYKSQEWRCAYFHRAGTRPAPTTSYITGTGKLIRFSISFP